MKPILYTFLLILLCNIISCSSCKKNALDSNGLPAATQTGANTFGFLLNGKPWTPQGFNGTANLEINVDLGYNNGIFGISGYRTITNNFTQYVGLGISDSLNFISFPATLLLSKRSLYQIGVSRNDSCSIDYYDSSVYRAGKLVINKFDTINGIISGTFNATLYKKGCDTVKITEGRFDMKF